MIDYEDEEKDERQTTRHSGLVSRKYRTKDGEARRERHTHGEKESE